MKWSRNRSAAAFAATVLAVGGSRGGGDASRFRFATPAAMVEALFRSVWMSTGLGGELDTQSMPRPRLPQIAKTCFDGELFLSGRAQMSVPAGPERSSCVPVHTTRPTERRRVQTRRTARV